eukprot:770616-Rhodomonas_salina.1
MGPGSSGHAAGGGWSTYPPGRHTWSLALPPSIPHSALCHLVPDPIPTTHTVCSKPAPCQCAPPIPARDLTSHITFGA